MVMGRAAAMVDVDAPVEPKLPAARLGTLADYIWVWFEIGYASSDARKRPASEGGGPTKLPRGEKELEEGADAAGPGGLVVFGAFDAFVVESAAGLPAFVDENVAETFDVVDDTRAFAGADVEPNSGKRLNRCGCGEAQDDALVPPDR